MPPAVAILFLLGLAAVFLASQNSAPSPVPEASPSPSPSPSITPKISPTPTPLPGAQNFHQWGSITVFNGLPSDSVRAIAQTPDGVMWFGTDNGLARFDGRRIQTIPVGGAEVDRILALKTSSSGELWIGTSSGAYVHTEDRFFPVAGTEDAGITAITIGTAVLLGTDSGFLLRGDRQGDQFRVERMNTEPIRSADGNPAAVTEVFDTNGRLLVGTSSKGVLLLKGSVFVPLAIAPSPAEVNAIAKDNEAKLWLGANALKGVSGVYSFDPNGGRAARVAAPTATVQALETDDDGLWAGTERYGLFQFREGKLTKSYTFANTSGGLRSDTVFTLFTDREGVLWIGTNRGASRFDRQGSFQETVSDVPNSNFIRTLLRLPGRPLLAGSNRGLFEYSDETWKRRPGFEERAIYAFGENDRGLIIGTSSGTFDSSGRLITNGDTRSITNFAKTYAAVIGRGVIDVSTAKQEVIFPDETACSLLAAGGRLWIGTAGHGLFSFDGKAVKVEVGSEILKSGAIWNMTWDVDQALWIAGQHGVFRVANGQAERIIEVEDVRDLLVEGPDVWAATTTRGLLHARKDERFGWLVTAIGFEQGLPSEKAFAIAAGDGLLIATNRGVVTYRPGTIAPMLIPVRILSQRVHDLAEARSTIPLEYPQNSLLVEVAGQSSRTFPEEFQYAFVLKNSKGEEVSRQLSNDPQYAPADLKPGDYAIEAIAFNRDLLASDPLVVRFSVGNAPFPWTATALGFLLAIAVIALVWAVVERRRIVLRNRELAAARLDLANEAERERSRIARDLHDQTLADLRGLLMKSDKELPADAGFREDIESISTEIRRICEDLSPSVLENVGLIAALEFLLNHTIENYSFDHGEATDEDVGLPVSVQLQIYRIAQEVLANIKQHAGAKIVKMKVAVPGRDSFELTIDNDGANFVPPEHNLRGGRGIGGIRSRAAMIRSHVEWTTAPEGHPRFVLTIGRGDDAA